MAKSAERISFWCLACNSNPGFSSNKPRHYLLDHGNIKGIIETFFLENAQWETATVNGDRYRAMLNEFLFTKMKEDDIVNIWLQQDGATCHGDILYHVFEDHIISRRADVWAAIWHRWTIISSVPSKISVTPTSQRQLTL